MIYNDEEVNISDLIKSEDFKLFMKSRQNLQCGLEKAVNYYQMLIALKRYYLANEKEIIANPFRWVSSYPCDWKNIFTPIEYDAWCAIRSKGRIVLYPQYPALNFHIDFANPGLKIGVELDGKHFHNAERDRARDRQLAKAGWKIYRISGTEMSRTNYKESYELSQDEWDYDQTSADLRHWLTETGDGVIEAIKEIHFIKKESWPFTDEDLNNLYIGLCNQTLEDHQLSYGKNK